MTEAVSVGVSPLAVLALLAFAVSLIAFLYRTSRHRSSGAWAVATGGFLVLVLLFGGRQTHALWIYRSKSGVAINQVRLRGVGVPS